jgi:glucokinase
MTTGGMFLGGGIPPKILPVLQAGHFMAAFTAKGRFEAFMKNIAVRVILNERASLLGAAYMALGY